MSEFLSCRFSKSSTVRYTYGNPRPGTIKAGDLVRVPTKGNASKTVEVMEITSDKPSFETKDIMGPADTDQSDRYNNRP